jgi:hypothetical protein
MSKAKAHRSSKELSLAAVAFLLLAGVLSAGPAAAHTFTKTDGNDSPGKLDLRSTSVSHTSTGVVHKVTTHGTWTPRSLGNDSFFIIQIDTNNDRNYERCAFIFFASGRLRGSLTNCRSTYIRALPVAKPSGTTARITIPKSAAPPVYWWGVASLWDGPAPCGNGCVDFAPNTFPDILHDLLPPVITMATTPLRVWQTSTTTDFDFDFTVSDAHSGVKSWSVQRQPAGGSTWTTVDSGLSAGGQSRPLVGDPGHWRYRVVATDKQGNVRTGPTRLVLVPTDDIDIDPSSFNSPVTVSDTSAFGGSYQQTDLFTYTFTPTTGCQIFEVIGPGGGDWEVTVTENGSFVGTLQSDDYPAEHRVVLFSTQPCIPAAYIFDQTGGTTPFAVDAVLGSD